ncbi:MAG: hypothetical protein WCT18_03345 [Patescibacteria group bacterium]
MKKLSTLSTVLFGIFFLAGCGQQQINLNQPTTPLPIVQQPIDQSQEIVYTNSKYQFSLNLPDAWIGYKVTEPGDGGTICFSIPTSGTQPFCIFQLYLLPENEPIANSLKLIGQTNGWQVAGDKNISCEQFTDFQCSRATEVPEILKTFVVTQ